MRNFVFSEILSHFEEQKAMREEQDMKNSGKQYLTKQNQDPTYTSRLKN